MFILVLLEDIVRIPPEEFDDEADAIHYQVNQKFANKVIENVGLCIEVYDILHISQGTVYAGDGAAFATVKFRMIVFKPFVGELLVGTIKSMDKNGVIVSFDFFDQVIIPPGHLQEGSEWDPIEKCWYWPFGSHRLSMMAQEQVRVRVEKIIFNPPESKRLAMEEKKAMLEAPKEAVAPAEQKERNGKSNGDEDEDDDLEAQTEHTYVPTEPKTIFRGSPMYLIVTSNESGLGLTQWWQPQESGEEQEMGEADYGDAFEAAEGDMEVEGDGEDNEEDDLLGDLPEKATIDADEE